jgi:hypothetical protein
MSHTWAGYGGSSSLAHAQRIRDPADGGSYRSVGVPPRCSMDELQEQAAACGRANVVDVATRDVEAVFT